MTNSPVRIDDPDAPGVANPTRVGSFRVQSQRLRVQNKPVYEINHDLKTVQFFDSAPLSLDSAEKVCTGLRSHLDLHKPKPGPVSETGPTLAPDFLQKNINALLEIPAGYVVRRGPRLLRWLWPYVIVKE